MAKYHFTSHPLLNGSLLETASIAWFLLARKPITQGAAVQIKSHHLIDRHFIGALEGSEMQKC